MFSFKFTKEQLASILPKNKDCDNWFALCNEIFPKYDINTPERVAGFLSQCGHESADFTVMLENLNYSAKGLRGTFGKYFSTDVIAAQYERQPEKIANRVYANRMGNGDEASGDGWKYRGKGLIQLTGHDNTAAFAKYIKKTLPETLEYLTTKEGALESACWFWTVFKDVNSCADKCDIVGMTKKINGGTLGLDDRTERFNLAYAMFKDGSQPSKQPTKQSYTETVKKGSKGDLAKQVQEALGVPADGIFGDQSVKALKAWQTKNGLDADGIAGPKTLTKLLG